MATAFAVMHPLDTFKTRLQAGSSSNPLTLRSMFSSRETLLILRKGFFTSVLGAGPQGGLRLATYEFAKSHSLSSAPLHFYQTSNPIVASALCAILGDFASSIVKVPREIVTAR